MDSDSTHVFPSLVHLNPATSSHPQHVQSASQTSHSGKGNRFKLIEAVPMPRVTDLRCHWRPARISKLPARTIPCFREALSRHSSLLGTLVLDSRASVLPGVAAALVLLA